VSWNVEIGFTVGREAVPLALAASSCFELALVVADWRDSQCELADPGEFVEAGLRNQATKGLDVDRGGCV